MSDSIEHKYDADDIQVLEGLEAVRKHPGMYLGDPHDGSAPRGRFWTYLFLKGTNKNAGKSARYVLQIHFNRKKR